MSKLYHILPTQEILQLILRTNARASVSECYCRVQAGKMNKDCTLQAPIRTCLTLTLPQSLDSIQRSPPSKILTPHEEELYNFFKRC